VTHLNPRERERKSIIRAEKFALFGQSSRNIGDEPTIEALCAQLAQLSVNKSKFFSITTKA